MTIPETTFQSESTFHLFARCPKLFSHLGYYSNTDNRITDENRNFDQKVFTKNHIVCFVSNHRFRKSVGWKLMVLWFRIVNCYMYNVLCGLYNNYYIFPILTQWENANGRILVAKFDLRCMRIRDSWRANERRGE